jgi:hypothetical protein
MEISLDGLIEKLYGHDQPSLDLLSVVEDILYEWIKHQISLWRSWRSSRLRWRRGRFLCHGDRVIIIWILLRRMMGLWRRGIFRE